MRRCLICQKQTSNPKFCSRSCAAKYNNAATPKRKPEGICKTCATPVTSSRSYCSPCWEARQVPWNSRTKLVSAGRELRYHARRVTADRPPACINCGYDKHVESCHIKPVSDFPDDAVLGEINHPDNLVLLCPNCHWELDHDVLHLPKRVGTAARRGS